MTTLTLSATEARNQFFPLLDRIARGEINVLVKKMDTKIEVLMGRPKAKVSFTKLARETYGLLKDVPAGEFKRSKDKQFLNKLRKQSW
jgi:hypothetical protein